MDIRPPPYERSQTALPPVPSARNMPPNTPQQESEWFLFYSPRSPPCMTFIGEAKKVDSIRTRINLINFDDDPQTLLKDNPWIVEHGLPCLAKDGSILSGRKLFDWLHKIKADSQTATKAQKKSEGPAFSHLGEDSFSGFSQLSEELSSEVATGMYSSIGAKQGSEGMDHENFTEKGSTTSGLSLDNIEAERRHAVM